MPRNQFQRMVFAFLTVLVTVHAYVFYSLYVVNGSVLMQVTGADSVLHALDAQGGVVLLSILCGISYSHVTGKLAETGMSQLSVCIFQSVVFYSAPNSNCISVFVSKRDRKICSGIKESMRVSGFWRLLIIKKFLQETL